MGVEGWYQVPGVVLVTGPRERREREGGGGGRGGGGGSHWLLAHVRHSGLSRSGF